MADAYAHVRELPLLAVLAHLGCGEFRKVKDGWAGKCPVHKSERNEGCFRFTAAGLWHCFSCGAAGKGAIDLVQAVRQIGFREAVSLLEGITVSPDPETPSTDDSGAPQGNPAANLAENKPFKGSYERFYKPHPWLEARGLKPETLQRYGVGFYENPTRKSVYNSSVMLPVHRMADGETVGYVSRNVGEATPEAPKYRFPSGFHKSLELWGAWELRDGAPHKIVIVVESMFAVMALHQRGFAAVSPMGWPVSRQQLGILKAVARGVLYLPDRNKFTESRSQVAAVASELWCRAPELPEGVDDPEYLTEDQIGELLR
jgi:DNA primase